MNVRREHCVDAGPGYRYEYDLFWFTFSAFTLVARSYTSEPESAHFLRKEVGGELQPIDAAELTGEAFREAAAYLRRNGKPYLEYLSVAGKGYLPVPP